MGTLGVLIISIASVLLFLLILYLLICFVLVRILSYPKKATIEFSHQCDVEKGNIPEDMSYLKREPMPIVARDGVVIEGDFSPNEMNRGIMILAHGYSWTREGGLKYAQFFFKHGFSIYLFDERSHGNSKYPYPTMGHLESKDICDIVKHFRLMYGDEIPIGLHGESMGAASTMIALGENPKVSFAIEDCGYATLKSLIYGKIKERHLPPKLILPGCNFFLKLLHKYTYEDVLPMDMAAKVTTPLLIIHGEEDRFVPFEDSTKIYEKNKNHAILATFPNAEHAESYVSDPVRYEEVCMDFIDDVLK